MRNPKCSVTPKSFWYPNNSKLEDIFVYRLVVNSNRVTADDFLCTYEVDKKNGRVRKDLLNCDKYYGVSTYEEYDDLISMTRKITAFKKFKGVACGITKKEDGLTRRSDKDSHVTWWLFKEAAPEQYFTIYRK